MMIREQAFALVRLQTRCTIPLASSRCTTRVRGSDMEYCRNACSGLLTRTYYGCLSRFLEYVQNMSWKKINIKPSCSCVKPLRMIFYTSWGRAECHKKLQTNVGRDQHVEFSGLIHFQGGRAPAYTDVNSSTSQVETLGEKLPKRTGFDLRNVDCLPSQAWTR